MKVLNGFLGSKKFWAVIGGIALLIVNNTMPDLAGLGNGELVGLIMSYIIGQGIADHGKERAKITTNMNDG